MRSLGMNAIGTITMKKSRRSFRGRHLAVTLLGAVVVAGAYALPVIVTSLDSPVVVGASVHAKNSETPGWMLELETRNARQLPVTIGNDEPSYWI